MPQNNKKQPQFYVPGQQTSTTPEPTTTTSTIPITNATLQQALDSELSSRFVKPVVSGLGWVTDQLSRGQYASAKFFDSNTNDAKSVYDSFVDAFNEFKSPQEKMSFSDLIHKRNPQYAKDNPKSTAVLGFLADVAFDPLSYLGVGLAKKGLQVGGKTLSTAGEKYLKAGLQTVKNEARSIELADKVIDIRKFLKANNATLPDDEIINLAKKEINNIDNKIPAEQKKKISQLIDLPETKIVDATGSPLPVYHGTKKAFDKFEKSGSVMDETDLGFFFTPDPEIARTYAGGIQGAEGGNIRKAFLDIRNPFVTNKAPFLAIGNPKSAEEATRLTAAYKKDLLDKGYDGIIVKDRFDKNTIREIIAFDAKQIKDAYVNPLKTSENVKRLTQNLDLSYTPSEIRETVEDRIARIAAIPQNEKLKLFEETFFREKERIATNTYQARTPELQQMLSEMDNNLFQNMKSQVATKGQVGINVEKTRQGVNIIERNKDGQAIGILSLDLDPAGKTLQQSIAVATPKQGIGTRLFNYAKQQGYDVESASGVSGYSKEGAAFALARAKKNLISSTKNAKLELFEKEGLRLTVGVPFGKQYDLPGSRLVLKALGLDALQNTIRNVGRKISATEQLTNPITKKQFANPANILGRTFVKEFDPQGKVPEEFWDRLHQIENTFDSNVDSVVRTTQQMARKIPQQRQEVIGQLMADIRDASYLSEQNQLDKLSLISGTKVADDAGNPIPVYHGTGADFSTFDPSKAGTNTQGWGTHLGFFFSPSPTSAGSYAAQSGKNANIRKVYLNIKNPYIVHYGQDLDKLDKKTLQQQGYDGVFLTHGEDILFEPALDDEAFSSIPKHDINALKSEYKEFIAFDNNQVIDYYQKTEPDKIKHNMIQSAKLSPEEMALVSQYYQGYAKMQELEMRAGLLNAEVTNYSPRSYELLKDATDLSELVRQKHTGLGTTLSSSKRTKYATMAEAIADGYVPELNAAVLYANRLVNSREKLAAANFNAATRKIFGLPEGTNQLTAKELNQLPKVVQSNIRMLGDAVYPSGMDDTLKLSLSAIDLGNSWFKRLAYGIKPSAAPRQVVSNAAQAAMVQGVKAFKVFDPRAALDAGMMLLEKTGNTLKLPPFIQKFFQKHASNTSDAILAQQIALDKIVGAERLDSFSNGYKLVSALGQEYEGKYLKETMLRDGVIKGFDAAGDRIATRVERALSRNTDSIGTVAKELAKFWRWPQLTEDYSRSMLYLNGLRMGYSEKDALKMVNKTLFDYSNGLSYVEKNVFKRLVPFYTFPRFAIPFVFKSLATKPGNVITGEKLMRLMEKMMTKDSLTAAEQEALPGYIIEQPRVFSGFDKDGKAYFNIFNNMTPVDALSLLVHDKYGNIDYQRTMEKTILAQITPFLKVPLESVVNKNFFTGQAIDKAGKLGDVNESTLGATIPDAMKDLMGWENRINPQTGKANVYINPYLAHTAMSFVPGLKTWIVDPSDQGLSELERAMELIMGVKTNKVDLKESADIKALSNKKELNRLRSAMRGSKIKGSTSEYNKAYQDYQKLIQAMQESNKAQGIIRGQGLAPTEIPK